MVINNLFHINLVPIVFSSNMISNKNYVLSTNPKEIVLPKIQLNTTINLDIDNIIGDYLKSLINIKHMELPSQFVAITSLDQTDPSIIDIVFGFLVDFNYGLNNAYWIEFDLISVPKHNKLFAETIRKLR